MATRLLTIGGVAREAGVNVETIRYYQRRGLLAVPALPQGGMRRYGEAAVKRIRFIKRAQGLAFSLREIAGLLHLAEDGTCSAACGAAEAKLCEIERRIGDLRMMHAELSRLVRDCHVDAPCPIVEDLADGSGITGARPPGPAAEDARVPAVMPAHSGVPLPRSRGNDQGRSTMKEPIRFCASRGRVRIAFATAGEGPPLVRVNNWFTHLELDWDNPVWRHWSEALAEGRTLIRYDPRGSGLSDRDATDFSLEAMVSDLEAVVDALNLPRFSIIGLCQGGAIAAAYAARHQERVSRLVLYDSYLHGAYAGDPGDKLAKQARMFAQMIEVGWGRRTGAFRELFANLLMPDAAPDQIRWIGELQRRSASAPTACQLWNSFNRFDVRTAARAVSAPSLVFHVRGDAMVPFEAGRRLAASIPNARFVPLEGKNHILLADEPAWATFRKELNDFLATGERVDDGALQELEALTVREREILECIARGCTNPEIADHLRLSEKTVRNHVTNVFSKLGMQHRSQAIVAARKAGFGRD